MSDWISDVCSSDLPIPRHLGIARHILVFFKKLGRIAAFAAVDPVAIVAAAPIATVGPAIIVVPAAIPATGLPVVDQELILAFTLPSFAEKHCSVASFSTA